MGRAIVLAIGFTLGVLLMSDRARREALELVRDLSDEAMMLLLRATSGFAADVSETILREEQERRTRWR